MEKAVLKIDGMHCSMCEAHVNDLFRKKVSLKKVSSSHGKGETVIIGEGPYQKEELVAALEGSGYKVEDVHIEPYEKKGFFSFLKKK